MAEIQTFPGLQTDMDPHDLPLGAAQVQENVQSMRPGRLTVRKGLRAYMTISGCTSDIICMARYRSDTAQYVVFLASNGGVYMSGAASNPIETGVATAPPSCWCQTRHNDLVRVNGIQRGSIWRSGVTYPLGIDPPTKAPTVAASGSGNCAIGQYWAGYRWLDNHGDPVYSELSPLGTFTTTTAGKAVSWTIPSTTQARVQEVELYRSAMGAESVFYYVATVTNGTTTYTDKFSDTELQGHDILPLTYSNGDPCARRQAVPPAYMSCVVEHNERFFYGVPSRMTLAEYAAAIPDLGNIPPDMTIYPPTGDPIVITSPGQVTQLVASGSFRLLYNGVETAPLAVDATSHAVRGALSPVVGTCAAASAVTVVQAGQWDWITIDDASWSIVDLGDQFTVNRMSVPWNSALIFKDQVLYYFTPNSGQITFNGPYGTHAVTWTIHWAENPSNATIIDMDTRIADAVEASLNVRPTQVTVFPPNYIPNYPYGYIEIDYDYGTTVAPPVLSVPSGRLFSTFNTDGLSVQQITFGSAEAGIGWITQYGSPSSAPVVPVLVGTTVQQMGAAVDTVLNSPLGTHYVVTDGQNRYWIYFNGEDSERLELSHNFIKKATTYPGQYEIQRVSTYGATSGTWALTYDSGVSTQYNLPPAGPMAWSFGPFQYNATAEDIQAAFEAAWIEPTVPDWMATMPVQAAQTPTVTLYDAQIYDITYRQKTPFMTPSLSPGSLAGLTNSMDRVQVHGGPLGQAAMTLTFSGDMAATATTTPPLSLTIDTTNVVNANITLTKTQAFHPTDANEVYTLSLTPVYSTSGGTVTTLSPTINDPTTIGGLITAAPTDIFIGAPRDANGKWFYSEVDEPESVPEINAIISNDNLGDIDSDTVGIPFGTVFVIAKTHRTVGLTYSNDPKVDGAIKLIAARGCLNARCYDLYNNELYFIDRIGAWKLSGDGSWEPISDAIQDLWREEEIDFTKSGVFFCSCEHNEAVVRYFVILKGQSNTKPTTALCYGIRTGAWWVETYGWEVSARCRVEIDGATRSMISGHSGVVYRIADGLSDKQTVSGSNTPIVWSFSTGMWTIPQQEPGTKPEAEGHMLRTSYEPTASTNTIHVGVSWDYAGKLSVLRPVNEAGINRTVGTQYTTLNTCLTRSPLGKNPGVDQWKIFAGSQPLVPARRAMTLTLDGQQLNDAITIWALDVEPCST